jgi:hypothetical protein
LSAAGSIESIAAVAAPYLFSKYYEDLNPENNIIDVEMQKIENRIKYYR